MISLVGYTGFVGSNLNSSFVFDKVYNSKNIEEAYGTSPELLIYSGVKGTKYWANKFASEDKSHIVEAINNIQKIKPKKIVLISTVDIFNFPFEVYEDSQYDATVNHAYGRHRAELEEWVKNRYSDYLIVRLPALYGDNIKKNFVYDIIHRIPEKLNGAKIIEFENHGIEVLKYYSKSRGEYYSINQLNVEEKKELLKLLKTVDFSSIDFTNSKSRYQFYNLRYLWRDIEIALKNGLKICQLVTEPISAGELYYNITGEKMKEVKDMPIVMYNCKTRHGDIFGGKNGYIRDKEEVMKDLCIFIRQYT